ncbi:MAG: DUF305 domain-containing protein [Deltaproteobacteria bacterium]|nr:DUF305 domain-containing protein [Deltaproteobacteria bacterium]
MRIQFVVLPLAASAFMACTPTNDASPHRPPDKEASRAAEVHPAGMDMDAKQRPYDLRFIDTMSEHHQMAVDMAKMAASQAGHEELKGFAAKVQKDQEFEIAQLRSHRDQHFAGKPNAVDHMLPGMMAMPPMDMSKLKAAKGQEFDHHFIDMMIPHHEAAVTMSEDAVKMATTPALKQMAQKMVEAQKKEIDQLKSWRSAWFQH